MNETRRSRQWGSLRALRHISGGHFEQKKISNKLVKKKILELSKKLEGAYQEVTLIQNKQKKMV